MPNQGIIAFLPVRTGQEKELRLRLNRIGNDVRGRRLLKARAGLETHIDLPGSATLHFARLALAADPGRGAGRERLLVATDHDGSSRDQADELLRLTTDPGELWGLCEGYPGPERFAKYLLERTVKPQAYYMAFPGDALTTIRSRIETRKAQGPQACLPPRDGIGDRIRRGIDLMVRLVLASGDALGVMRRYGFYDVWMAARKVNATLSRVGWIRIFNWATRNALPPLPHFYTELGVRAGAGETAGHNETERNGDETVDAARWEDVPREDLITQNQLTLLTVVRPERLRRLLAVLAVIDIYAGRLATPGSLVGISTIHTVRWAVVDEGLRLLMVSNYDNTWENYIDEFAEMILSGLDAIWENCYGYPQVGARDVVALKHFLRLHQVPANVFYSAVPHASVLNILDGMEGRGTA